MKWFSKQKYVIKYTICISLLFIILLLCKLIMPSEATLIKENKNVTLTKNVISSETEKYTINVNYPKFKNIKINKIITDWLYEYIKTFKSKSEKLENTKTILEIDYTVYFISNHVNIYFTIDNSLNNKDTSKSILINLNNDSASSISEIYSEDLLIDSINEVKSKYPSYVSEVILSKDINEFDYLISDDALIVTFNDLTYTKEVSYIPQIKLNLNETVNEEYSIDVNKKMVALTFDDGPSNYSLEILKCLELNDAKATFFELGTMMKSHPEITKKLYTSGMEIGNHTYSHKYLTKLSAGNALEQINSVSILFNEITGANISLMRAPYGSVNATVRENVPFPIVHWSIDTKDWLHKDANISAPIVLDYVKDGDIILMHDVHYATMELVRMVVPELKARGYELVTVSDLAKYKGVTLEPGVVVKSIVKEE